MKPVLLTALAGLLVSITTAYAQTETPPPATSQAAPAAFTLDTPIEDIAADPAARAVLDKDLPHLRSHPSYEQFKTMSLNQIVPYSEGKLTPAALARTQADLAKIKPPSAAQ